MSTTSSVPLEHVLESAFAPLHKRALGLATGLTTGAGVFALTLFHLLAQPQGAPPVQLLAQYFYGFEVTWPGAIVGMWWGFVVGFVAGWFVAFVRNFALAAWLFVVRARAELAQAGDFLDHI